MNRKKVFLIMQSVLIILLTVMMAAALISTYREGAAAKADDVLVWIFSREKTAEIFLLIRPVFYITIFSGAVGLVLDIKDEKDPHPVKGCKIKNPAPVKGERILRAVLLTAAVCLLVAGVFNGSAKDVFGKAVNICTECIGLG